MNRNCKINFYVLYKSNVNPSIIGNRFIMLLITLILNIFVINPQIIETESLKNILFKNKLDWEDKLSAHIN